MIEGWIAYVEEEEAGNIMGAGELGEGGETGQR